MKSLWTRRMIALLLCAAIPAIAAPIAQVVQNHRAFSTTSLKVARGTVVHFLNQDEFIHHIEVDSPQFSFDSGEQEPGKTVDVAFTAAGTFDVHCAIHPKMHLSVEVQ